MCVTLSVCVSVCVFDCMPVKATGVFRLSLFFLSLSFFRLLSLPHAGRCLRVACSTCSHCSRLFLGKRLPALGDADADDDEDDDAVRIMRIPQLPLPLPPPLSMVLQLLQLVLWGQLMAKIKCERRSRASKGKYCQLKNVTALQQLIMQP